MHCRASKFTFAIDHTLCGYARQRFDQNPADPRWSLHLRNPSWLRGRKQTWPIIKYPRIIEFREALPMTATGKILKSELC
ncbi:MAG TPA: hypothetical protein VEH81_05315 [Ktedonobacteraceae bacterium]|nr:hypothetical protein [Ktedonobacteraceae bacterium]